MKALATLTLDTKLINLVNHRMIIKSFYDTKKRMQREWQKQVKDGS